MKKLSKILSSHKNICFLDFEGTQFSHECIAIGAVIGVVDRDHVVRKSKKSFKVLVKPKNKIGKYVENLTGLTDEILERDGVTFAVAMDKLYKYLGNNAKSTLFVTYGTHDMTILGSTISYNLNAPMEKCKNIQKNYLDFLSLFSEYVRDQDNQMLSLVHACEIFEVEPEEGVAHDPEYDAIMLMKLWNAFMEKKDIVFVHYKELLKKQSKLPGPILKTVRKLSDGGTITADEYDALIKEDIKNI